MPGGADAREGRAGPPERAERRGRGPEARRGGRVRLGARAWEAEPRPKGFMGPPAGGSRRGRAPGGELLRA